MGEHSGNGNAWSAWTWKARAVRLLSHMKHKRQRLWHSGSAQAARTPHLTQTTHRNTRARASNTHAHTHHVHHPHTLQHRVVRCFTKHRPGSHCTETDCPGISTVRHALDCIAMVVTCGCPMKATRVTPPRSTPTRAHLHLLATASCLCAPPCTLHRPVQHQQTCALGASILTPLASRRGPDRQCRRGIAPAPCPP